MELQKGIDVQALVYFFCFVLGLKVATLFVTLYWVTTLALVTPEVIINRNAYGVYFNPLGPIEVATDTWSHVFDLQIPLVKFLNGITTAGFTCGGQPNTPTNPTCSNDSTLISSVSLVHQRAEIQITNLIERISQTLTLEKVGRKKYRHGKRGLINVVGTISHSLFGLVTDSDFEAFGERFKTVLNNQERLIGQFHANINQLASATSITNKRLDTIHTHIQTQDKTILDLSNAVTLDFQTSLRLSLYLAEASYNFTSLEINLHSFLTAVESLKAGRLVPGLLHPEDIKHVLVQIVRQLSTTKSPVRILVNNPTYFYKANDHVAVFHRNLLGISIKIPITTLPQHFNLYKVIAVPKAISSDNPHSTLISDLPTYFAVSPDNQFYASWNDLPTLQVGDPVRLIDKLDIQIRTNTNTCIMALYLNEPHSFQKLCKTVLLNTKPSSFLYLPPHTLAIENSPSNFSLNCPKQQPTTISSCSSCILEIPTKCTLLTTGYYFPASSPQTDVISNHSHTITLSFNLAIIQEFFASPDWEHIKADTALAQQITLRLPKFLSTSNSSDNDEANDKLLVKDLNSAINDDKNGQVLFKTTKDIIQEQLDNLEGPYQPMYNAVNRYSFPAGAIVMGVIVIINIYLMVRVHRLSILITALTRPATAYSVPPIWVYSAAPTSGPTPDSITLPSLDDTWFKLLVLSLLTLIIVSWICSKLWKCFSHWAYRHEVFLALNFTNTTQKIVIPWFHLTYAVNDYDIVALSQVSQIRITRGWFRSTLKFKWPVQVLHKPSRMSISLPQTINMTNCLG